MRILVTGGAGFIGRYVARECAEHGHAVRVLDTLSPQIHGSVSAESIVRNLREFVDAGRLSPTFEFTRGSVCDADAFADALRDQDIVIHLAAETGTGQSMYDVTGYERVNIGGTAQLAELLGSGKFPTVRRVILASSRAVYGEGQYRCLHCGPVFPPLRSMSFMQAGDYEPPCPGCGGTIESVPTSEKAARSPASFYGLTKMVQEDIVELFARTFGYDAFILRFQNVYGPMQSLTNPYTGILSIFSSLARRDETIKIFEDGRESRDFVYVEDVARAVVACATCPVTGVHTVNIGTGCRTTVQEVAATIRAALGSRSEIVVTGQFRVGDIRHAFADIRAARALLGFEPTVNFATGVDRFVRWASTQATSSAGYEHSLDELARKGLLQERSDGGRA